MFEAHNTFNTYDRLRAHASTFRSTDHITKSINNSHPAAFSSPSNEMDYHRSGMPMQPTSVTSNGIFPRSASEAQFDTTSKFRQLPCRTFISVGTCPYRERCVYLHDPRCICKEAKTKTRRKNKEDVVLDSLFWPVMPYPMVAGKLDMNRQPHVIQSYSVPIPQYDQYHTHDAAVYSLWMHFVDFCMANNESSMNMYNMPTATTTDTAPCYCAPNEPVNSYTNQSRLQIFQFFASCHGCTVSLDEVLHASSRNMPINARHVHIPRVARTTTAPVTSIPPPVMFKAPPLQDPIASSHHHHLYNQSGAHTRVSELYDQQQQQGRGGASIPSSFAAANDQTSRHSPGGNYPSRVPYKQDTSATAMHAHYTQYQQQNSSNMGRFSPQPTAATATAQYTHRSSSSSSLSPVTATMERSPQLADHTLNPTAAVFTSTSYNTMKLSHYQDTNTSNTNHSRLPPTSMSVLNSIPQSNDTQHQQQQQKVRPDFLLETSDPWAADSCYSGGITDDERDSGSSFNSDSIQDDMNAIWKKPKFSNINASTNNGSSNSNKGVTVSTRNNSFSMLNSAITAAAGVGAALSYAL